MRVVVFPLAALFLEVVLLERVVYLAHRLQLPQGIGLLLRVLVAGDLPKGGDRLLAGLIERQHIGPAQGGQSLAPLNPITADVGPFAARVEPQAEAPHDFIPIDALVPAIAAHAGQRADAVMAIGRSLRSAKSLINRLSRTQ